MSLDVAGPVARPGPPVLRIGLTLAAGILMAGLMALVALAEPAGDPVRGEQLYGRCIGCHALERNRTGPQHCGLVGRQAGTVEGFRYSEAMVQSGIVWTPEELDRFLADPLGTIPGTRMGYAGMDEPQDRTDLIAYLLAATADGGRCP
jgi:cytochrome c